MRGLHGKCAPCKWIKDSKYCDCTEIKPSGNVTNPGAIEYHNGMKFSTFDSDNDTNDNASRGSCPKINASIGWWYGHCYKTLLAGKYKFTKGKTLDSEVTWDHRIDMDPIFVEMKFRRKI